METAYTESDLITAINKLDNFAMKLSKGDRMLASDMLQDTFYSCFKNLSSFHGRCQMHTWAGSVLKNKFADHFRKKSNNVCYVNIEDSFDIGYDHDFSIDSKIILEKVLSEINSLPDKNREVMFMCMDGYSSQEVADKFGSTAASIDLIRYRARQKILKKIKHYN